MIYNHYTIGGELYHYGVAHDENPPGRGSGRYPFGSGEHTSIKKNKEDRVKKNEQKEINKLSGSDFDGKIKKQIKENADLIYSGQVDDPELRALIYMENFDLYKELNEAWKPSENTENFKDTRKKMSDFVHYGADETKKDKEYYEKAEQLLRDAINTKAMQDFLYNDEVRKVYEKRNKYLDRHEDFDDNGNEFGPTTTYGCGIVYEKEIKDLTNKFFGDSATKSENSSTNRTNSDALMSIIKIIDMSSDPNLTPYYNDLSWLHWH